MYDVFFFFSSRRRHTRYIGDWSSDVCSSDLAGPWVKIGDEATLAASGSALPVGSGYGVGVQAWYNQDLAVDPSDPNHVYARSEERRVGKECRCGWAAEP